MTSLLSQLSPELEKSLSNKTATIDSVLLNPSVVTFFKMNCEPLTLFFCHHAKSLLHSALSHERSDISDTAFEIITAGHIRLFHEIIHKKVMSEVALEVLSNSDGPTEIQLSRLSDIISFIFAMQIPEATENCEYLYCLLKRADNINVSFLFRMLFGNHEQLKFAQARFSKMKFPEFISNELFHIKLNQCAKNDLNNPIFLRIESYFKILQVLAQNKLFQCDFSDEIVSSSLLQSFNAPNYVIDAQWQTIYIIFSINPIPSNSDNILNSSKTENSVKSKVELKNEPKNLKKGAKNKSENHQNQNLFSISTWHYFIEPACSLFHEVPDEIHFYHQYALLFLSTMLSNDHSFASKHFLRTILAMFIKFENCSIFHFAIRHFIFNSLTIRGLNVNMALTFAPILVIEAELRQYGIVAASALPILNAIFNISKFDKDLEDALEEIDGFSEFVEKHLKKYQTIVKAAYGGPVAKPSSFVLSPKSLTI
ncbi:hypothetical protein TRFO_07302 [Tritrichomonas foetus]|uniref:Uncharacterized protein n=1 Tax=Tritrichomonas foetus TaxID=1144522 RepID=A0A1J4JUE9_9EUKA|nr:hypothetical protein TRFO_07302 [Tritrichomonas foetus]|eukprot:OHT02104.1 hypothetical protein TRFO_07302 [Tritrichomonas foetus]